MALAGTIARGRGPAVIREFLPEAPADLGDAAVVPGTWTISCPLPGTYDALGTARRFVRGVLRGWGLGHLCDDVALVASELVANALRHGVGLGVPGIAPGRVTGLRPGDVPAPWSAAFPVELTLISTGTRLMCLVDDPGDGVPVRRSPDSATGSGRGLQLIESLSHAWGWTPLERSGRPAGKEVWAVFEVRGAGLAAVRAG